MNRMQHIAVIDDERESLAAISRALRRVGYRVDSYEDSQAAIAQLDRFKQFDLVITDLKMPRVSGMELLRAVRSVNPEAGVLMVTGHGTVETAVEAMRLGADDYILKPLDLFELRDRVRQILESRAPGAGGRDPAGRSLAGAATRILGDTPAMQDLLKQIATVAPTRSTVLLLGESGSGKDLVAQTIHENSPREARNFLPLNCAALSPSLLESELFGYEAGAFTGARQRRLGKLEMADRGTLFLDEIGEMPPEMQVKLLRFLETREVMRVGGNTALNLDVRLIAATNRDLVEAVSQGTFRTDLYYRLRVVTLRVPSLRERTGDIPRLAWSFVEGFAAEQRKRISRLDPELLDRLVQHPWPGNVRELRNLMESLVVFCKGDTLRMEDLPPELRIGRPAPRPGSESETPRFADLNLDTIERQAVLQALERSQGNRQRAAKLLGMGLRTLQKKLKEYGLTTRRRQ